MAEFSVTLGDVFLISHLETSHFYTARHSTAQILDAEFYPGESEESK
jgi:hypothetical protein